MAEWVIVKLVAEHNHSLPARPSKYRMYRSHSTAHHSDVIRQLINSLNSERIGPSNIARVYNAAW